jgi:hypothetical protein
VIAKIASIVPEDRCTWAGKTFLTIDVDWASDYLIDFVADMLEAADASATWFITHDTPLLDRLRSNRAFELGIHPNFNWLLSGDSRLGRDMYEVVSRLMEVVPEARCVRSHSLTSSSRLSEVFRSFGLTHECNFFQPMIEGQVIAPWRSWVGMTSVPHFFEDDLFCLYRESGLRHLSIDAMENHAGLQVFDFHPIHIYLNTESLSRYEQSRSCHGDPEQLSKYRYAGVGAAEWFGSVLRRISSNY